MVEISTRRAISFFLRCPSVQSWNLFSVTMENGRHLGLRVPPDQMSYFQLEAERVVSCRAYKAAKYLKDFQGFIQSCKIF